MPKNWHSLVTQANESCNRLGGGPSHAKEGRKVVVADRRNQNTGKLTIDLSHKKNRLSGTGTTTCGLVIKKYDQKKETGWLLTFFSLLAGCWLFSANVLHVNILLVITIHRQSNWPARPGQHDGWKERKRRKVTCRRLKWFNAFNGSQKWQKINVFSDVKNGILICNLNLKIFTVLPRYSPSLFSTKKLSLWANNYSSIIIRLWRISHHLFDGRNLAKTRHHQGCFEAQKRIT